MGGSYVFVGSYLSMLSCEAMRTERVCQRVIEFRLDDRERAQSMVRLVDFTLEAFSTELDPAPEESHSSNILG